MGKGNRNYLPKGKGNDVQASVLACCISSCNHQSLHGSSTILSETLAIFFRKFDLKVEGMIDSLEEAYL